MNKFKFSTKLLLRNCNVETWRFAAIAKNSKINGICGLNLLSLSNCQFIIPNYYCETVKLNATRTHKPYKLISKQNLWEPIQHNQSSVGAKFTTRRKAVRCKKRATQTILKSPRCSELLCAWKRQMSEKKNISFCAVIFFCKRASARKANRRAKTDLSKLQISKTRKTANREHLTSAPQRGRLVTAWNP